MTRLEPASRATWLAFSVLCLGDLMIVLDSTIVNVALPTIRQSLGFSEAGLVWVVNAYLLTFGGFLLLGGRLADLYGQRRVFVVGVVGFTLASLACGLALDPAMLVAARAMQGFGGAVVSAVALSLIMSLFPEGPGRVRAMGYFGFVMAGGGSVGVLLGGLLTALDWRAIFLVNLPVGAAVTFLSVRLLPKADRTAGPARLDVAGAATVTLALMLAVWAIVNGESAGWVSLATLGSLAAAAGLFAAFLLIESTVDAPLVPLRLFAQRNVAVANTIAVLWAVALFAWFFLSALYLQNVLRYGPMQVGLAFLPANLIMGAFSYSLSAKAVTRFGVRAPLAAGLGLAALGLALFAAAPAEGRFLVHVLPPMLLLGLGAGLAFNPMLLAAMSDVAPSDSGLASGVVNTAFMMGGSVGLAALASLAATRSRGLDAGGADAAHALAGGYQAAFLAGAVCAGLAGLGAVLLRIGRTASGAQPPLAAGH